MIALQPSLLIPSLLAWSGQVLILAVAGALASLAISSPKARLFLWQGLLVAMLLLPAIEPWKPQAAQVDANVTVTSVTQAVQPAAPSQPRFQWREGYWLWLIGAGALLRLVWIAAGFVRLRRYRLQAKPLAQPPLRFAAAAVNWYSSDSVPGPVTYGWRNPVILLPARVLRLPDDIREAIQCHELIHVRRSDWLFVLGEAILRSLLWFHPAIWFALSRIQLAREQAVDQEAVALLENRERYLDALIAVAEYRLQPDLAPAPLFLRKRHLAARVHSVVKEMRMSRSRMIAAIAAVSAALPAAALTAMWLFPFISPAVTEAQTAPDSAGITVDAGATLLHRAPVRRPQGSTAAGTVVLQATIGANGEVTDAHVLSGPDELRNRALSSVLQWHYQPGPSLAQVSIQFAAQPAASAPPSPTVVFRAEGGRSGAGSAGGIGAGVGAGVGGGRGTGTGLPISGKVKSIQIQGISSDAEQVLRNRLTIHEGDTLYPADIDKLRSTVQEFDSHLVPVAVRDASGDYTIRVMVVAAAAAPPPPPPPPPPQPGAAVGVPGAQRMSAAVQSAKLVTKVPPTYPAIAKQARIQGAVTLDALIGTDGTVQRLQVVSADSPLLVQSAVEAVKQWVYQPTLLNGQPIQVQTTITVNFSLEGAGANTASNGVYRPGGDVSTPKVTYQEQPAYTEQARAAKWQGSVLLSTVIDPTGAPTQIKVVRPLGMGLDENAVAALAHWRFEPGMKDGVAVPVQAQIEMTFNLQ